MTRRDWHGDWRKNFDRHESEKSREGREGEEMPVKIKPITAKKENLTRITDEGISFKSMADGAWHFLNAEKSMQIQSNLDSDIIMAFDECTSPLSDYDYTNKAMQRTHVWAEQSIRYHDRGQALYGIIQGGWFEDLRNESTSLSPRSPLTASLWADLWETARRTCTRSSTGRFPNWTTGHAICSASER